YIVDNTPINDPNSNTVRYTLTGVDSCGNEEAFTSSPWQNTMYMIQYAMGKFTWSGTGYLKQGVLNPVTTYVLYRDSAGNGNWKGIDSVSGTQNVMNDAVYIANPGNYPSARWYVGARLSDSVNNGCTVPLLRPIHSSNSTSSRSNTQHNGTITSINQHVSADVISVYPNPATQNLNIKFSYAKAVAVSIMNVTGREVYSQLINDNSPMTINVSGLPVGVYFVKVTTNTSSQVVKFIKE
ncbi:MAG TPA: T9SS type A sorting domain-containing protein, partial [Bacteroidia bacterium]|nr:T9SS type A sorting domain-containing protein [Bacteroidia bacterium]